MSLILFDGEMRLARPRGYFSFYSFFRQVVSSYWLKNDEKFFHCYNDAISHCFEMSNHKTGHFRSFDQFSSEMIEFI